MAAARAERIERIRRPGLSAAKSEPTELGRLVSLRVKSARRPPAGAAGLPSSGMPPSARMASDCAMSCLPRCKTAGRHLIGVSRSDEVSPTFLHAANNVRRYPNFQSWADGDLEDFMGRLATSQSICLVSVGRRPKTVTSTGRAPTRRAIVKERARCDRWPIQIPAEFGVAVCAPAPSLVGQDRA